MALKKYQPHGHAARPTMDELLASRERMNRVRADFLKVDLQTALTFVKIARQTHDDFQRRRSCRAARRAYDTIVDLVQKVNLTAKESGAVKLGLTQLQSELLALGEIF